MSNTELPGTNFPAASFRIRARQLRKLPPCQAGCPNSGDIRSWLGIIAQHEKIGLSLDEAYDEAWLKIVEVNPLPATTGRICPHPCEDRCTRSEKDGAVSINAMERFLGDWGISRRLGLPIEPDASFPESIGVVGSGPASLSFAYQMARRGYAVTMYEKHDRPGGMLRYAIPDYRLPREVLDAEVERVLDNGINLLLNTDIGTDIGLEELRQRHTLMFLGLGAQHGRALDIPGEQGPHVLSGIAYLHKRKKHGDAQVGKRVLVIGGGNTAIDAARTARREGAAVTLCYRRSEADMPAAAHEVEDARREGVEFRFLASPTRVIREGDAVRAIEIQKMRLGEADEQGRPQPMPIPGCVAELEADTLIVAASQETDLHGLESIHADHQWLHTAEDGHLDADLWAGGDDRGPGIASRGIAQGRFAAEAAHAELRGEQPPATHTLPVPAGTVKTDYYPEQPRSGIHRRPAGEWLSNPNREIDQTLDYEQACKEAARCMSCGLCFDCEQCFMYCNAGGFTRIEKVGPGQYYALALDACEGCGKCIELCPCGYLEPRDDASRYK